MHFCVATLTCSCRCVLVEWPSLHTITNSKYPALLKDSFRFRKCPSCLMQSEAENGPTSLLSSTSKRYCILFPLDQLLITPRNACVVIFPLFCAAENSCIQTLCRCSGCSKHPSSCSNSLWSQHNAISVYWSQHLSPEFTITNSNQRQTIP